MLFSDDFSNAFLTLLTSPVDKVAFSVFNVGDTSENYTKKMIVDEIIKLITDVGREVVERDTLYNIIKEY